MYKLNITPASGKFELHTLDVPYQKGNRSGTSGKAAELMAAARRNMVNIKTGVRALGDRQEIKALTKVKTNSREEAEQALLSKLHEGDEFITCVKVQPVDGDSYWLYAALVPTPAGVLEDRKQVNLSFFALLSFDTTECQAVNTVYDDDAETILKRIVGVAGAETHVEEGMIVTKIDMNQPGEAISSIARIVSRFHEYVAGSKYEGAAMLVRYV
ncbi:hypothetical protein [Vibrio parahaemolyticus]|uniref:hypothetical protein n=1 Tax=Vibrio parahaemolyticus TaxID=670 RepID=UPI0023ECC3B7|nr:hypothetical protein [Vibrio parahaemolyticus]